MLHNQYLKTKINRLQERCLPILYLLEITGMKMGTLARNRVILLAPTPQNGQTHSLFELFDNFVRLALQR